MNIETAIEIAARAHRGQVDKAGLPYILHPLRVMLALDTPEGQMAGVLHDVVEDTSVTLDDLKRAGFSHAVVNAVDAVSRRDGETYEKFISRIIAAGTLAIRVKLADVMDNMSIPRITVLAPNEAASMTKKYVAARKRLVDALGADKL